jgi:hypothetical protein
VFADPAAAALEVQTISPRSIFEPFVMTLEEAQRRTGSSAPSDSDRPAARDEATEPGVPSGVGDLAGVGGRGMPPAEGAEELAPLPEPGDVQSSEAHSRPGPEVCSSGPTLPGPLCEICGRVLPPRSVRYCDGKCRGEAVRRRRFLASRKAVSP